MSTLPNDYFQGPRDQIDPRRNRDSNLSAEGLKLGDAEVDKSSVHLSKRHVEHVDNSWSKLLNVRANQSEELEAGSKVKSVIIYSK